MLFRVFFFFCVYTKYDKFYIHGIFWDSVRISKPFSIYFCYINTYQNTAYIYAQVSNNHSRFVRLVQLSCAKIHSRNTRWTQYMTHWDGQSGWPMVPSYDPGACITIETWRCRKTLSQWVRSCHWKLRCHWFNSLVPGKFELNFRHVIFKQIWVTDGWGISCEIALIWMSLDLTDDQSTLVQVMA